MTVECIKPTRGITFLEKPLGSEQIRVLKFFSEIISCDCISHILVKIYHILVGDYYRVHKSKMKGIAR